MFQTVFVSIIRRSRLYIQQQEYVNVFYTSLQNIYTFTRNFTHLWNFIFLYACCCMYKSELLMMELKTVRNM